VRENRLFAAVLSLLVIGGAASCGGDGTSVIDDPGTGADATDPGPLPDAPDAAPDVDRDVPYVDPGTDPAPDGIDEPATPDVIDVPDVPAVDPGRDYADIPVDDGPPVPSFNLVTDGASSHVIVVAEDASPSERNAANEMQALFLEATGVTLPIVAVPQTPDQPQIVIGQGVAAKALGVDPAPADIGEQGYVLRAVPPHVVIAGTPAAGTMYGVHRFVEEALKVRWTAPGVTIVPKVTNVVFPQAADRTVQPAFNWRRTRYSWPDGDHGFRVHQGENDGTDGPDAVWGLEHGSDGQAHTYFRYVSPDEFFDTHPEYFSEIGGVRIREETQLCLTNPDVLDIVTERMLARMAASPEIRQHNFSQHDHYNVCECDTCKAMNKLYGTDGGTQFWFVSELAKRTSAVYPDKQIGTLAYMYTEEPPVGLDIHPNVAIWLCHMYPSCDSHPIRTCDKNADYKRRAQAWSLLTHHLYIWHYIVDFMHYYNPFPNFYALADNAKFYKEIGVEGMFLQGMSQGGGGEFSLLRPWFGMKLLWDPDQDPDRLIRRFLEDYYGAAWGPMYDWIRLLQDKVDDENIHMHLYTNPAQGYLTEDVVVTGEALFAEAVQMVADDPVLLDRVQVAAMPLGYARFFPRNGYRIEDGWLRWNPGQATFDEVLAFIDMLKTHGFTSIREAQGSPDTMTLLYVILGVDQEVKTIRNAGLEVDVVPALAGRALRITDRASGKTITAYDRRPGLFYPFAGGLEDRVGEGFNFFGWVEPGSESDVSERGITVSLKTFDGLNLSRTLTLDPDQPILRITSTVTNPGPDAVETRLRSHLEMDLGDVTTTRVAFTGGDGVPVEQDMTGVVAGMREGQYFRKERTPAGAWTFTGSKGLRLTHRFTPAEVDFTQLYAYPVELKDLEMEIFGRRTLLQAGESVTMHTEIEVRAVP
jgi:hypothetical protein